MRPCSIIFLAITLAMIFIFSESSFAQDCTNPNGIRGAMVYNTSHDVFQGCTAGAGWVALHCNTDCAPQSPQNCPNIGDTCDDGTVYAGLSPDGSVPMYTTPADADSTYTWNDGSSNWLNTAMEDCSDASPGTAASCQTGEANTTLLVGLNGSGSPAPYDAAEYCAWLASITAHGYDDWYLPAQDELNVLYTNRNAGALNGTFATANYWSSSENLSGSGRRQNFSTGGQSDYTKNNAQRVRCVRK